MNYNTIGERIKHHRKELGLTQEQLAERIGVSAQAVSKWENNLSCPDISILPDLADMFGITTDELLGKQEAVHVAEPIKEPKKNHFEWQWKWGNIGSLLFPLMVVLYGGLWLMNEICGYDVSWWTLLWTLCLVYAGIETLKDGFSAIGIIMLLTGTGFLLSAYDIIQFKMRWSLLIPICIVIWGLGLLFDIFGKKRKLRKKLKLFHNARGDEKETPLREYNCADGMLHCEMAFGQDRIPVVTPLLHGGDIETNFGNFTIDFSACEAVTPNCTLNVENNFGKLTLLIPEKFKIEHVEHDNFAASTQINQNPSAATSGTIYLNCENNFGSVEINYI